MTRSERILGSLWGAAIGDALGAAFEFVPSAAIEKHLGVPYARDYEIGIAGSLLQGHAAGVPTDDTAMALSVALTVAEVRNPTAGNFAQRFLDDLKPGIGMMADMFWSGGPGGATTQALRQLGRGAEPAICGDSNAGGNGAAMRAHPVGFLRDRSNVLAIAEMQARVTHGHPAAVAAAAAVAVLVHDAIAGKRPSTDCPAGVANATFRVTWDAFHAHARIFKERLPAKLRDVEMSGWENGCRSARDNAVFLGRSVRSRLRGRGIGKRYRYGSDDCGRDRRRAHRVRGPTATASSEARCESSD